MAAEPPVTYDPAFIIFEGLVLKLSSSGLSSIFGSIKYKWEKRWVALTPTSLLYFKVRAAAPTDHRTTCAPIATIVCRLGHAPPPAAAVVVQAVARLQAQDRHVPGRRDAR